MNVDLLLFLDKEQNKKDGHTWQKFENKVPICSVTKSMVKEVHS